jgi:hypothetical protein
LVHENRSGKSDVKGLRDKDALYGVGNPIKSNGLVNRLLLLILTAAVFFGYYYSIDPDQP